MRACSAPLAISCVNSPYRARRASGLVSRNHFTNQKPFKVMSRKIKTGYGAESLPKAFAKTAMIAKPFSQQQLIAAVALLGQAPAAVHRLRR